MAERTSFTRVAILNRGEPAIRFLRALREYAIERRVSFRAIAVYTDPDVDAPAVRLADESIALGPALVTLADGRRVNAYCDIDRVVAKLVEARVEAVWPGWGFVSEDADFVRRLEAEGIVFLGPSSDAMERLGDKIAAKQLAFANGVPMGRFAIVEDHDDDAQLRARGASVGYPLMVKASSGGGGRGIRKVSDPDDLVPSIHAVGEEALRSFGRGGILLEECIAAARHIEVQFVVGVEGRAVALGVRDCSIQRRNQKVIEEAPSPVLPPLVEAELCEATVRLAEAAGYRGVGTAEFLFHPQSRQSCFLEVNSRLQVEHTITEAITGIDLVKAQIDIARGLPWEGHAGRPAGWAIEARLNAEDADHGFRPAPGQIRVFRPPSGPGVRIDSGVVEGSSIAPEFDSMIAKVIAWGPSRRIAIARLERALREFDVVVEDGATNKAFLLELLGRPEFLDGSADTGWLDRVPRAERSEDAQAGLGALATAGIVAFNLNQLGLVQRFFAEVHNGVPQNIPPAAGLTVELSLRGRARKVEVHATGRDTYVIGIDGAWTVARFELIGQNVAMLHLGDNAHRVLFSHGRTGISVEIDGVLHAVEQASGGEVRAPAPAMVAAVAVEEGDTVKVGDLLCTLEAMKMESPVFAPADGVVQSVLCRPNQQVAPGQALVLIRPEGDAGDAGAAAEDEVPLRSGPAPLWLLPDGTAQVLALEGAARRAAVQQAAEMLRALVLGWDAPAGVATRLAELVRAAMARPSADWIPLVDELPVCAAVESLLDRSMLPVADTFVAVSAEAAFFDYCRRHHMGRDGARVELRPLLDDALQYYALPGFAPTDELRDCLWRLAVTRAHPRRRRGIAGGLLRLAAALQKAGLEISNEATRAAVARLARVAPPEDLALADDAWHAVYVLFEQPRLARSLEQLHGLLERAEGADAAAVDAIVRHADDLLPALIERACAPAAAPAWLELCARRLVAATKGTWRFDATTGWGLLEGTDDGALAVRALPAPGDARPADDPGAPSVELLACDPAWWDHAAAWIEGLAPTSGRTVTLTVAAGPRRHASWRAAEGRWVPVERLASVHPALARRLGLERLDGFVLEEVELNERMVTVSLRAESNRHDERIASFVEVFDVPQPLVVEPGRLGDFERGYLEAMRSIREAQQRRSPRRRFHYNRVEVHLREPVPLSSATMVALARTFEGPTRGLHLNAIVVTAPVEREGAVVERAFVLRKPGRHRLEVKEIALADDPLAPLTDYELALVRARRLGAVYPYEMIRMLVEGGGEGIAPHPDLRGGTFAEYDLVDGGDALVPVDRPWGQNTCGVVVGIMSNPTPLVPEGVRRVFLASDPTRAMGALAEPECRRVIAALDLAAAEDLPVEWIPVSAGARIAMDSGTENLDWTAAALRRIVRFTQEGGTIHVIVCGVNVGAQSYWNAEATMLMHTRGLLIMTPDGSMVLTGKKALEYSGGVSAEDERGIGGFERIMGPNGEAQYFARDLGEAWSILFSYYRYAYRPPGERRPRRAPTSDPATRSIRSFPYPATESESFATVGEIFDESTNPGRRRPFAIRPVMEAVIDQDGGWLERFRTMRYAETAVVWDTRVGGHAVTMIGVESKPLPRRGRVPLDGPEVYTGGTLFPWSSRKVARAINAASGNRPVVVLANLSGFDGSPESLRRLQLEYGAEIGRAVVNFDGPIIFVVIGRYHGGAYVVFSKALNPGLRAMAVEGAFASVIGGAPAAAVVFPRDVEARVEADARVVAARAEARTSVEARERLASLLDEVRLEHRGAVAREFDAVHTVQRAVEVGSLDAVVTMDALRAEIVASLDRAEAGVVAPGGEG